MVGGASLFQYIDHVWIYDADTRHHIDTSFKKGIRDEAGSRAGEANLRRLTVSVRLFLVYRKVPAQKHQFTKGNNINQKTRGGVSPSPSNSVLLIYGVVMGNGVAFTQADTPAPLNARTLK
jgi:hypothetical protein